MFDESIRFRALIAGAISGALVLGVLGKLALAVVALVTGLPTNLSPRGMLEAALIGAVVGALGGALLPTLRAAMPGAGPRRGVLLGMLLFVTTTSLALIAGLVRVEPLPVLSATLFVVVVTFIGFGLVLDRTVAHRSRGGWPDHHAG